MYDQGTEASRDIKWTRGLDPIFRRNYDTYPGISWQYFGTVEGIHRQWPGRSWPLPPENRPDMYDARRRPWYVVNPCCL